MELETARSDPSRRAAIVYEVGLQLQDAQARRNFHEALHTLALQTRLLVGAHQCAISYIPGCDFHAGIHTHSFSEKYEKYNTYDVMPTGSGIWALVVKQALAVRMSAAELLAHPFWRNFSDVRDARGLEHPPMRGWLAVPVLRTPAEVIGVLQLSDRLDGGEFSAEDLELLTNLAKMVAPTFELHYLNQQLSVRTQELRVSRERFELAVRGSTDGIWDWNILTNEDHFSDRCCELMGFEPRELPRVFDSWSSRLHPEDRDRVLERIRRHLEQREPYDVEYRLLTKAGEYRWFRSRGQAIWDETGKPIRMAGSVSDIHERRLTEDAFQHLWVDLEMRVQERTAELTKANAALSQEVSDRRAIEQELRESEQRLRILYEHSPDAIFVEDAEGNVLDVNQAACRLHEMRREQLIGANVLDLVPAARSEEVQRDFQRLIHGELAEIQGESLTANGRAVPVELRVSHLDYAGKPALLLHVRDISERKQAEEMRRTLEAQMQHAQKLESLGLLAGGIAHDFNNLLTSILGYSDLALLELPAVCVARNHVNEAIQGARRAAELATQMLAYSGKGRFVVMPLDLSKIVEEMLRLAQVSISKKCGIRCSFEFELPSIEADPAQVRQVVMNLILNAAEAIGDQEGEISIETGAMSCDRKFLTNTYLDDQLPAGKYVYLDVADTGCGMTKETQARIFDPFFTTKFTGRGLGLAAVLGIVRGHRGAIKCSSRLGKGTMFKVLFPASNLPVRTLEQPKTPTQTWQGKGTVLIVDDEDTVRRLACQMMEGLGFQTLSAADGREGVEIFRRECGRITLVILDMTMPHLDGEEAFNAMKQIRSDVRVILSSGYHEHLMSGRFAGKGIAAFLHKPYRRDELIAVLRQVLENGPKAPASR